MKNRLQNISKERRSKSGKLLIVFGLILTLGIGALTGCEREDPDISGALPENGSAPSETGSISSGSSSTSEESPSPEASKTDIPPIDLSNSGHSSTKGTVTELTENSVTIKEEKGNISITYQLNENTTINVPDGLKEGDSVFILSTAEGSLAQIISIADVVSPGSANGTILVSPPTNIDRITASYDENEPGHKGVDLTSTDGENGAVFASVNGTVIKSGYDNTYGYHVIIQDDEIEGLTFLYAHCSELFVKEGDSVIRSQQIAKIGSTGMSTGNHLHFEVRMNGEPIDPVTFLGTAAHLFKRDQQNTYVFYQKDLAIATDTADQPEGDEDILFHRQDEAPAA